MESIYDVQKIRSDFPQTQRQVRGKDLVYLDNAATSLKPKVVIDTVSGHYSQDCANVHRGAHYLSDRGTGRFEEARNTVRKFINANSSHEIVFVRGTTEGINLVADTLARRLFEPGDEIILTELEHHSNIVPWQMAAEERELKIRVVPIRENGELDMDEYRRLLGDDTKMVAFTHCSNGLGVINPAKEIIAEAKKAGALTLIDAAQSVPAFPVDVQDLGCDFLVFSGHKVFGPTGIGVLYGREDLLNQLPPYQGGGSMIERVTFEKTTYLPAPHRFEAGTTHIAGVLGLGAALEYVSAIGMNNVFEHEHELAQRAISALRSIGGIRLFAGDEVQRSGVVSFLVEGAHPSDVGSLLDQQGVAVRAGHHCNQPLMDRLGVPGTVRASFSIYNNYKDVDSLVEAVEKAKELLL